MQPPQEIQGVKFKDVPALLSALKENRGLKHLSLQDMEISDECMEVLSDFTSLTTLHLQFVKVSEEFVVKLEDLHPSHSPLAASLHRLSIFSFDHIDWRRSTGFLRHWPHLNELALEGVGYNRGGANRFHGAPSTATERGGDSWQYPC